MARTNTTTFDTLTQTAQVLSSSELEILQEAQQLRVDSHGHVVHRAVACSLQRDELVSV